MMGNGQFNNSFALLVFFFFSLDTHQYYNQSAFETLLSLYYRAVDGHHNARPSRPPTDFER